METDDLLPISALRHLLYCERSCALNHVLGMWAENVHTVSGRLLHERADTDEITTRPGVRVLRSLVIESRQLGLRGVADVVEMLGSPGGERPYPVEYKRGKRRKRDNERVQLAAQAMALEEMTGQAVPEGAIFHGASKRRQVVAIDEPLRELARTAARRLHQMVTAREVPAPVDDGRCEECSLAEMCLPGVRLVRGGLAERLREALR
jgi:CRISPR-associated exonuclease Cas4